MSRRIGGTEPADRSRSTRAGGAGRALVPADRERQERAAAVAHPELERHGAERAGVVEAHAHPPAEAVERDVLRPGEDVARPAPRDQPELAEEPVAEAQRAGQGLGPRQLLVPVTGTSVTPPSRYQS